MENVPRNLVRTLYCMYCNHIKRPLQIIKYIPNFAFCTEDYLLRHIQYRAATLVFLLTLFQHKYRDIGYLYWCGGMSGTTLHNIDAARALSALKSTTHIY